MEEESYAAGDGDPIADSPSQDDISREVAAVKASLELADQFLAALTASPTPAAKANVFQFLSTREVYDGSLRHSFVIAVESLKASESSTSIFVVSAIRFFQLNAHRYAGSQADLSLSNLLRGVSPIITTSEWHEACLESSATPILMTYCIQALYHIAWTEESLEGIFRLLFLILSNDGTTSPSLIALLEILTRQHSPYVCLRKRPCHWSTPHHHAKRTGERHSRAPVVSSC